MSKKEAEVCKSVFEYLNKQNRPYSAIDIFNNLHKEFGKTAIVKACESLTEAGKIKEKLNGKQKAYVADQSQFPDVDDGEIKAMDDQIASLVEKVRGCKEEVNKMESELKALDNALTTADAKIMLKEASEKCENCQEKLKKIKEGSNSVSPEEKEKVYKERTIFVKEWRKRKRMANDILGAILEGYPKTKKQLYEDIGIETDEEYKVSPPEI